MEIEVGEYVKVKECNVIGKVLNKKVELITK